ncbi:hypothetical protein DB347_12735 [Opitutaceae bacterium EW11]|nr:hypothetical protein DB347_12735 [Opitutaceae bacterium EW11]
MAGFVLVVALCASLSTLTRGYQMLDAARSSTMAAQILQSEIERIRLMSWTDLTTLQTTIAADSSKATVDLNGLGISSDVADRFKDTSIALEKDPDRNMMSITVTVRWKGSTGIPEQRSFTTRYSKNGFYDYCYTIGHP